MIKRDDMLELTRRMNPSRNCFFRIAGAYMRVPLRQADVLARPFAEERDTELSEVDEEGFDNGTFNIHFGKLSATETKRNLEIAKTIPFSDTNEQLKEYKFPTGALKKDSMWPILTAIKDSELKDDALLSILYEVIGENYKTDSEYSIYIYYGSYDVPNKGTDGEWMEGGEEVYDFLICAISPLVGDYEPGKPEFGFLFPAFKDRSGDDNYIDIYNINPDDVQAELMGKILGNT